MTDNRPPIPAEIRRRVFVEAGHRCAIPTCRYIEVDIHHIIPWAQCQAHEYDNLIALCPNCHRRADAGDIDRKALRLYKFNLRFAHDKFSNLEMDLMFELSRMPPSTGTAWPAFNMLLIKRATDAGYIGHHRSKPLRIVANVDMTPHVVFITQQGRDFLASLGVGEL